MLRRRAAVLVLGVATLVLGSTAAAYAAFEAKPSTSKPTASKVKPIFEAQSTKQITQKIGVSTPVMQIKRCAGQMTKVSMCEGDVCTTEFASCFPYRCNEDTGTCPFGCAADDDCAPSGAKCLGGQCRAAPVTSCSHDVMTKEVACNGLTCTTSYASCFPYKCKSGACKVEDCSKDSDCATGAICISGSCGLERWSCGTSGGWDYVTNGRDQYTCGNYKCSAGACKTSCTLAAECADVCACANGKCLDLK